MLKLRPAKEQIVLIDRFLQDPKLPGNQRLPLEQLRSFLMVDLEDTRAAVS